MANLTHSSTSYTGSNTQDTKAKTYTFSTKNKYLDQDIIFTATAKDGSASTPATTITANPTLSTTKETNGYKMSVSKTQDVTPSVSAGWVSSGTKGTITVSGSAYVAAAVLGSEGSVSTAPSVTIGGTTNMTTATSGTYYFTRTGVANNGTVQTKYKATTAGYTPTVSATNGGTVTVTPGKTADATVYIPTAVGSVTMTAGAGSVTGSNAVLSNTNTSGVSVSGKGSVSATGKVTTAGYSPKNDNFASGASTSSNTATQYITGITLGKGYQFDITNSVSDKVTVKYNSASNSLDFVFA